MASATFNSLAILDAIPHGELNTARHLRESILDLAPILNANLHVSLTSIDTPASLDAVLSELVVDAETKGRMPWLHIEGHGVTDETGFQTANGGFCSWNHLKEILTPLNIATRLNVIVVFATCYGGSFASAITTTDRAPVLGLIGPGREIMAGDVELDFKAFYRAFFASNSIKDALCALTARSMGNAYFATNAQTFFCDVWRAYKRTLCTPEMVEARANVVREGLLKTIGPGAPSLAELKSAIRGYERPQFIKFRDTYFMYDLFPENRERFHLTYEEAESQSAR